MPRVQLNREEIEKAIRLFVYHNLGINLTEEKHNINFRDTGGIGVYVDYVDIDLR